jgi:hypothetical protein
MTVTQHGSTTTLDTTRWNGNDVVLAASSGILGPNRQLLLVGGGVYVQRPGGGWLHYAHENDVGARFGPGVELARANVSGNTAQRVLALTHDITRAAQPGGSTAYTGTIPTQNPTQIGNFGSDDAILRLVNGLRGDGRPPVSPNPSDRHPVHYDAVHLKMTVAADGLVKDISLRVRPTAGTARYDRNPSTWRVTYSRLGDTPPISAPAKSTPTTAAPSSAGSACPPPPHGPCGP